MFPPDEPISMKAEELPLGGSSSFNIAVYHKIVRNMSEKGKAVEPQRC